MWKLALRNVFRHRSRTALTLGAIALSVASLIISGGFVQDFLTQLREATIHSQFGHLQIYRAGYYELGRRAPFQYMIENPQSVVERLRRLNHISDITLRVNFSGLLSNGRQTFPILGEGVEPEKELKLFTSVNFVAGTNLPPSDAFAMIIGQGVANTLNLKIGEHASVLVNTPEGALNTIDFRVAGIFQTFSKEFDDRVVRIPLMATQELFASKAVHSLVLVVTDTTKTDDVRQEIARLLPSNEFEIKTWYELADFYQKAVDLYERYFLVLRIILLGLILLSVVNSVNMTLYERTAEFGTLMALGNRGKDLFKIIMRESILLGLIGSITGVALGTSLAEAISQVGIPMPPMPNSNSGYTARIQIVPLEIQLAFFIGLASTVGAAILPAHRVSRLSVIGALRHN